MPFPALMLTVGAASDHGERNQTQRQLNLYLDQPRAKGVAQVLLSSSPSSCFAWPLQGQTPPAEFVYSSVIPRPQKSAFFSERRLGGWGRFERALFKLEDIGTETRWQGV